MASERFECLPARILRQPIEKGERRTSRRGYTRIRFGARFMRYTVANNRSGNSAGIVSAGVVHSTPQTLSFEPVVPARHRHYHCYHPSPVDVVCTPLDTRQMTISPSETERARFIFLLAVALFSSTFSRYLPAEFAFSFVR